MPAHTPVRENELKLLEELGERLKAARIRRNLSVARLAREVGVSRTTLYAVEAGDASVTMGTYLRTLSALGLAHGLTWVAAGAPEEQLEQVPGSSLDLHRRQDLRSLALHEAAVRVLRANPDAAQRALTVLDRWEAAADEHSKPLRDEWRRIIEARCWDQALAPTERGQQLRQASPLGFVLDEATRTEIMRRFSREAMQ